MKRKILTALLGAAFGLGLAFAPSAHASMENQLTKMVFNQPVQIPGNKILPAGTYWFKADGDYNIVDMDTVQIYNAKQNKVIATLNTIPTTRSRRIGRSELVLAKQSNGNPAALLKWFYPSRATGHEFVYSPQRESKLTAENHIRLYPKTIS